MKKRLVLVIVAFLCCIGLIKSIDIIRTYEIGVIDYVKYSMPLTQAEKKYLKENGIRYGIDVNDAPFSSISYDDKQNTGIFVDYFNQLSVTLEAEPKAVTFDNYNLAKKLKAKEIDAAVLNMTDLNSSVFLFTQHLYTDRSKVLVKGESTFENLNAINNISIAVIAGTTAHHEANRFFHKEKKVKLVLANSLEECFYLFSMNQVDAILGDEAQISYHLNRALKDKRFRFLEDSVSEEKVAVAVNKDNELLFTILNKGILQLKKNNQFYHTLSKTFGGFIPETKDLSSNTGRANTFIFVLGIIFLFLLWNRTVSARVTEKTRELHDSKDKLKNILDSLMDGVIVTDHSGVIEECNLAAINLLGSGNNGIIRKRIEEIDEMDVFLAHANEKAAFKLNQNYYLVSKRDFDATTGKQIILIEDYTERHQYEMLTKQEAKMIAIGELVSGLTHEIRNPLGLIKSYIFILKKKKNEQLNDHAIEVIDHSADRINTLIENLLNFSRLSREDNVLVDVAETLEAVIELESANMQKHDIQVDTTYTGYVNLLIKINEDILKLALINLINNSIDSLIEKGDADKRISISIDVTIDKLTLVFHDNGMGIPTDKLENVFNPFFTTKENGTGLGLYILHSEIRRIGGKIIAESEYTQGATFVIAMPIEGGADGQKHKEL